MSNELCRTLLSGMKSLPSSLQRSQTGGLPQPEDILGVVERSGIVEMVMKVESVSSERSWKQDEGERLKHRPNAPLLGPQQHKERRQQSETRRARRHCESSEQ